MKKILLIILLFIAVTGQSQIAGDYQSAGNVALTSATNWQTYDGTSWIAATTAPNSATLVPGNTITVLSGNTWNNTAAATIPEGVTFIFKGTAGTFTPNTLTINGTYIHATGPATGSNTTPSTVFTGVSTTTGLGANSTVIYRASGSYTVPTAALGGRTYNNLIFDTDGTTVTQPSFAGPGFTSPLTINGTFTIDSWKTDFYTSGNTTAVNINGDVVLTGSSSYLRLRTTTIAAGKSLTINAGDSLGIAQGFALTINGTLLNKSIKPIAFATSSSLVINGTLQHDANGGSIPNSSTTYNAGSTILVTGLTNVSNIPVLPATCANVVWNCPGQTGSNTFVNTITNATTINGNLTVQSTGTASIYLGGAGTGRTLTVNGNVIVSGGKLGVIKPTSSAATANQNFIVNGDVIVSAGEFYVADASVGATGYTGKGFLSIGGNLNHTAGTFGTGATTLAGTGNISFISNNTDKTIMTTGIAGATTINIDKTAAGMITLTSNITLPSSATLNFVTGKLAVPANTVLELSAITGANASGYIATLTSGANTGKVKMSSIISATTFPVGTLNNYLPVIINPLSSSDYLVGVFEGLTTNAVPNGTAVTATQKQTSVDAVWLINRSSSNTDNATITVNWPASLEGSAFAALNNNIGLGTYTNQWQSFTGTGDNTANTATNTFDNFSAFAVGGIGTTLPVTITSISAVAVNGKINISWEVQNETGVEKYVIERSIDGTSFVAIESVLSKGNSTSATYSAIDNNPFNGENLYRIKSVDRSGQVKYSAVVSVNNTLKPKCMLSVAPNPVHGNNINLQLKNIASDNYAVIILNNAGQLVYSKNIGNISGTTTVSVFISDLSEGVYQLVVKGSIQQLQQTIIVR